MTRNFRIAGNWKMNLSVEESTQWIKSFENFTSPQNVEIWIAPQNLCLPQVSQKVKTSGSNIQVGAQNAHWESKGAFTGENSPALLKELGVSWALLGHSERRNVFGETDELVQKRLKGCVDQNLQSMLCVGETLEQRESSKQQEVVGLQLTKALKDFDPSKKALLSIAYEPVWAIGTGVTATPEDAQTMHQFIKNWLETNQFGNLPVLYGGSAKPENTEALLEGPSVDGLLVGGASLKPESFQEMIRLAGQNT